MNETKNQVHPTWFFKNKEHLGSQSGTLKSGIDVVPKYVYSRLLSQLISKCLFGIFNSPKKRTKEFDINAM